MYIHIYITYTCIHVCKCTCISSAPKTYSFRRLPHSTSTHTTSTTHPLQASTSHQHCPVLVDLESRLPGHRFHGCIYSKQCHFWRQCFATGFVRPTLAGAWLRPCSRRREAGPLRRLPYRVMMRYGLVGGCSRRRGGGGADGGGWRWNG